MSPEEQSELSAAHRLAAERLASGARKRDVVIHLVDKGLESRLATEIVDEEFSEVRKSEREKYVAIMRWGILWMALGLVLAVGAFILAPGEGYVIAWALVALGFVVFLLRLSSWILTR